MEFSEKIRNARIAKGWSQDELADHSGISRRTIQNYELGARLPKKRRKRIRSRVRVAVSAALVPLNLSLFVPFTMLVMLVKPVSLGLIPAIAMAAYTTYKITMAIVHLRRRRVSRDPLVKELRSINFIDALVSILTLQNTLIMVNDPDAGQRLLPLTASVTAIILSVILFISVLHLVRAVRSLRHTR